MSEKEKEINSNVDKKEKKKDGEKVKEKKKKNSIKEKEVEKEVDLNEMNGKLNNFIKIFINPEEIFFNKRSKNKFCSYFKKYYFKLKTPI